MYDTFRGYALPESAGGRQNLHDHRGSAMDHSEETPDESEQQDFAAVAQEIRLKFPGLSTPLVGAIEDVLEKLDTFIASNVHAVRRIGFRESTAPSGEARVLVEACREAARFFGHIFAERGSQPLLSAFGQVTDAVEANLAMYLLQFSDEEVELGVSQDHLGERVRISIALRQQLRLGARQIEGIQAQLMMQLAEGGGNSE